MLIIRRKLGEALLIGDEIQIKVVEITEKGVRLAIDAPRTIPVLRSELCQAADANRDAVNEEPAPQDLLTFLDDLKKEKGGKQAERFE